MKKLKWEDLIAVIEAKPGLLINVATLRKKVCEAGYITLDELIAWQGMYGRGVDLICECGIDNVKVSPCCGAPSVKLRSIDKRICPDCSKEYDWELEEGQKADLTERVGGRE